MELRALEKKILLLLDNLMLREIQWTEQQAAERLMREQRQA